MISALLENPTTFTEKITVKKIVETDIVDVVGLVAFT